MVASASASDASWIKLGTPAEELRLEFTLPTGQSFRWREISPGEFLGVVGQRAVHIRQLDNDVCYRVVSRTPSAPAAGDTAALSDYFNLSVSLSTLAEGWRAADPNFKKLSAALPGARMLRQDPVECLFSFICSQNNHISRIHGMVNKLCELYGTELPAPKLPPGNADLPHRLFAFPTLDQLVKATEEQLRTAGFGYRARFIVGAVEELNEKPEGGKEWLMALRSVPFNEAVEELCTLPGVGPKVAACCALFSLDKHDLVPVDTHVWQLAQKFYTPQLRGKAINPKLHGIVQAALVERFGPYAGWAHNTLFIAELASMKKHIHSASGKRGRETTAGSDSEYASESESESDVTGGTESASDFELEIKSKGAVVVAAVAEVAPITPPLLKKTAAGSKRRVAPRDRGVKKK